MQKNLDNRQLPNRLELSNIEVQIPFKMKYLTFPQEVTWILNIKTKMKNLLARYALLQGRWGMSIQKASSKIQLTIIFLFSAFYLSYAQPGPQLEWTKNYTTPGDDEISCWVETGDGYLIGGRSKSDIGGSKSEASKARRPSASVSPSCFLTRTPS
jgi:hypothetical protein